MTEVVKEQEALQPDAKTAKAPKQTAEEKAAVKAAKAELKAKEKAEKDAAKVEVAKDTKNGVTRPARGVTLLVWTTADQLSATLKAPTERAPLVEALKGKVEVGTIHTQYGRWRKYYGLVETKEQRQVRLEASKVAKKEAAAKVKAEKQIEKDSKAAAKKVEAERKAAAKAAEAAKQAELTPEPAAT